MGKGLEQHTDHDGGGRGGRVPRGTRVKTCEGAAALQAERGPERGRWRRNKGLARHSCTHLPALCAHWPSLISEACPPLQPASQEPYCAVVVFSLAQGALPAARGSVVLFSLVRGLSLQHVVSGPVLSRAGALPAAHGSVVLFSLAQGLSLQHVGQWSCSLSRRGSPCSTWVSGPVLSRVGTFPAACGSVVLSSLTGGSPCSTWVSVHPVPGVPAPLFADVLFQTSGPTQPWFPPAYLAAPSAFPAHF